jgi:hypothetical protein
MRPSKAALWKAIRSFCIECMGGSKAEIERCTAPKCPLYPWRLGAGNSIYKSGRKPTGRPFRKPTDRETESVSGGKENLGA